MVYNLEVALLAEGVDRNNEYMATAGEEEWSPSSRRAWIEIHHAPCSSALPSVALLAEGVDRNCLTVYICIVCQVVALLAEGVDRNSVVLDVCTT